MIGLKELSKKYGYREGHFRTLLCRPEFNQFRMPVSNYFTFDDSDNFHKMLKHIIDLKNSKKYIILFALVFNMQTAFCQQYEPVIIYNQLSELQTILKGKIIYDNYGVPKFNTPTKRGMSSFCKKQGD